MWQYYIRVYHSNVTLGTKPNYPLVYDLVLKHHHPIMSTLGGPGGRIDRERYIMLCAIDKEFSMCATYPKRKRELFHEWIDTYHPGALLLHAERASGSCQDLAVEGSGAVYMSHPYWIDFLDERLRTTGDNILQDNIFIIS